MAKLEVSTGRGGFTLNGTNYTRATMTARGYFRPKSDCPKSYKKVGMFISPDLESPYNSGIVSVYKASDGGYRFETYRDGCFYPFYGNIEFNN